MKILVYPTYSNPYQQLIYGEIRKKNIEISFIDEGIVKNHYLLNLLIFPFRLIYYRILGYSIFHLHWVKFNLPLDGLFFLYVSFVYTLFNVLLIKILGYKLVWTVHNLLPHEQATSNDLYVSRFISKVADAKIIHSSKLIAKMNEKGFNIANIFCIPHGNYIDVYPNNISKSIARKNIGINNEFVFLFFGMVRRYKGILQLVESFIRLETKYKNIKLVIAGSVNDHSLLKDIKRYKSSNIIYNLKSIKDEEIQIYMNSCDVVVLPFTETSTSGSAILAYSFKKSIIAPKMGNIADFPQNTGYFYNPEILHGLEKKMEESINSSFRNHKNISAFKYIQTFTWKKSADLTIRLYNRL